MKYEITPAGIIVICEVCGARASGGLVVRRLPNLPDMQHLVHPDDWAVVVVHPPAIFAPRAAPARVNPGMNAQQIAEAIGCDVRAFACKACLKKAQRPVLDA